MILVTGATGQTGSQVVQALLRRRQPVRVLVRDPARAAALLGNEVQIAVGDFADPRSLRAALDGVQDLFLSGADDPRRVGWETAAIDAAARAGVRRIVKLSSIVAEPGSPVAFWDWHGRIEQHLARSGVAAVVLRSSYYLSNLLAGAAQVAREGRLYAPAGAARIAMIDPRDVGAAAAAVLASPGHEGRTYVLTGPEAVSYAQIAAELTIAGGREVAFVDVADDAAREAMVQSGLPEVVAEQIVRIFAQARAGVNEQVTGTVAALTGRPPRDLAAYVREHAHLFSPTQEREEAA